MAASSTTATTTMDLPFITFGPAPQHDHTHTVIFLHGRGDNMRDFARSLDGWLDSRQRTLAEAFPSFRWVFPQAPTRTCQTIPNTTWPQWFDVANVQDFADREEMQLPGLREVVPQVRRILAREADLLGGRWDRVVLAGISMGAATSVHTLFNLDVPAAADGAGGRLAAFMGFSCRCPFAGRGLAGMREVLGLPDGVPAHDGVVRGTPMLLEHCVDDPLVKIQSGRTLRDTLAGFGAMVEWREYPEGGHWFNQPAGMDDAVEFLERIVLSQGQEQGRADEMDLS